METDEYYGRQEESIVSIYTGEMDADLRVECGKASLGKTNLAGWEG